MKNKLSRFAVPYVVWMAIFVVAPILIMVLYAFSNGEGGATLSNFVQMGDYAAVFGRSFKLALIATAICLLIGYPVSYYLSREGASFQRTAMVLIMLPMWMNFLLRTYSWMTILENHGLLNQLFEKIGITCEEMKDKDSRKLIFVNEELKLRFFLAKGPDVPTYVEYGAADIGIVGKDTILEEGRKLYEVMDLGFGKCKMCICGPAEAKELLQHHEQIRVATKYPRIAKDYFYNKKHQTVEIIKLNGSIELAPIVGLSEVICDIVETGSTLRENGLVVLEEVCPLSARMVVNQVSMKMENERITKLIRDLKTVIQ